MIGILSIGWHLPAERHTVSQVAADHSVSEAALRDLGLRSKVIPADDEHPSQLAARATQEALRAAGKAVADVDLLIFTGITRDQPAPWVGAFGVLHQLGNRKAAGFDLSARCPGIHDALWVASSLIRSGTFKVIVVCAGDRFDYLLPRARHQAPVSEALYSAGGTAAVISADADNEIAAYSHCTNEDLSLHSEFCPTAGGSRLPLTAAALEERKHVWQNKMTVAQGAALNKYLRSAEQHNVAAVSRDAGFDQVDFVAVSPLDVRQPVESLRALGIGPEKMLITLATLGHLGPGDTLISVGFAIQAGRRVGPHLVMSSRSITSSNAVAIRGRASDLGIRVSGPTLPEDLRL